MEAGGGAMVPGAAMTGIQRGRYRVDWWPRSVRNPTPCWVVADTKEDHWPMKTFPVAQDHSDVEEQRRAAALHAQQLENMR